ncbi:LPS assembly lipoprotein LptE [Vibrio sp.]|uniref:LPS-assembly lipoprotein LptE n=1 Tax=Vibrio viridaestus TaxID=2487322 RepID=A0A3N9TZR5_9VIBR|nr:LPS assembly lipoprotein LptE [Vibrio viridaestus]MDC0611585.1 LPS assembly lipoprotein LptE [Vibrio sp.]RQW62462.1 luciferase [Vibrio viridaestus]
MQLNVSYIRQFLFITLVTSLLSACGFHLRGDYSVPEQLDKLSVTSYDQYSTFTRLVKKQLTQSNVDIVSPAENTPNLHLSSESLSSRTLSVYQNTRTAETELTLTINYRITIPNIGQRHFTTSVTRSYLDNPLAALAKSMEKSMITDEMRKLAAQQVIRQMARLKVDFEQKDAADEVHDMEKQYKVSTKETQSE